MGARRLLAIALIAMGAPALAGCQVPGQVLRTGLSRTTTSAKSTTPPKKATAAPTNRAGRAAPKGPVAPAAGTSSAAGLKPVVRGLVDRQGKLSDQWAGVIRGIVVNLDWASVQPTTAGSIDGTAIDTAVATVRRFNLAHPSTPVAIKLRVVAGSGAPAWLKQAVGTTYVQNPVGAGSGDVPYWWTPRVETAYRDLMAGLAARYDAVPEIREVQISQCSLIYPEPLIRMRADEEAFAAFKAHGLNRTDDLACLRLAIDAHVAWKHTRSALALNPYQDPDGKGSDVATSLAIAAYCRSVLGARCVLENHSIRETSQGADYEQLYAGMQRLGRPLALQTAAPAKVGSLDVTLRKAVAFGAEAVELPYDYRSWSPGTFSTTFADVVTALARPLDPDR